MSPSCLGSSTLSLAMPDIHLGYGFPVGGVAATRTDHGVISPGGVGFDINCGVRLLRTELTESEVRPHLERLVDALYRNVPTGVGSKGKISVNVASELDQVMTRGCPLGSGPRVRGAGGYPDHHEEGGAITGADPDAVSSKARERGAPQLGTLGSGNHFLEVEAVEEIFDPAVAGVLGIDRVGQVTIMIHCGSRGFGHQICTDYLKTVEAAAQGI